MRTIKLMADYQCFPLWETYQGDYGDVDPDSLPISASLAKELLAWAGTYDATLNLEDHTKIGFTSQNDADKFKAKGYELAERLQKELGRDYQVVHNITAEPKNEE